VRESAHRLLSGFRPGLDAILSPLILIVLCCLIFLYYEEPMRDVVRNLLVRKNAGAKVAA
jgi:hypothetical protein